MEGAQKRGGDRSVVGARPSRRDSLEPSATEPPPPSHQHLLKRPRTIEDNSTEEETRKPRETKLGGEEDIRGRAVRPGKLEPERGGLQVRASSLRPPPHWRLEASQDKPKKSKGVVKREASQTLGSTD